MPKTLIRRNDIPQLQQVFQKANARHPRALVMRLRRDCCLFFLPRRYPPGLKPWRCSHRWNAVSVMRRGASDDDKV